MVGRKDRGRAAVRLKLRWPDPPIIEGVEDDEEQSLNLPWSDLHLGIAVLEW